MKMEWTECSQRWPLNYRRRGTTQKKTYDILRILQAYIRSKAVMAMHHFYRVSPQLCLEYVNQMKMMAGDKDPGVVAHVLQFLLSVAEVCLSLFILLPGPASETLNISVGQYHTGGKVVFLEIM
jgi:hypothetical protein